MNAINGLSAPQNIIPGDIGGGHKAQNLQQAAEQFEALFLRSMMQQMRKAADALSDGDNPFSSKQQQMMRDFYDDKLTTVLASQRSSGIAEMIVKQLSPQVEGMERALKLSASPVALPE
ncbi:peptidoglycan hydrolase [Enterobacteriaceae bacterium RIT714]|nr:peptidoglycan hydrolase [Enterobacteriaceae bacterium RIT714]